MSWPRHWSCSGVAFDDSDVLPWDEAIHELEAAKPGRQEQIAAIDRVMNTIVAASDDLPELIRQLVLACAPTGSAEVFAAAGRVAAQAALRATECELWEHQEWESTIAIHRGIDGHTTVVNSTEWLMRLDTLAAAWGRWWERI